MMDWWWQLKSRERAALQLGGIALVLMLLWALALQPLAARQSTLQARIAAQQVTLQKLAEARALLAAQPADGPARRDLGGQSMASAIEQGLRMAGLAAAIRRIEPSADGSVFLVLEQAAFDPLVRWLQDARAQLGIAVLEVSLDAGAAGGTVNTRMRLAAGG